MSIAINTRHVATTPRAQGQQTSQRTVLSPREQLRESRALLRHLILAAASVGALVYAAIAAGLTI